VRGIVIGSDRKPHVGRGRLHSLKPRKITPGLIALATGTADSKIFYFAAANGWMLSTRNLDFGMLLSP